MIPGPIRTVRERTAGVDEVTPFTPPGKDGVVRAGVTRAPRTTVGKLDIM